MYIMNDSDLSYGCPVFFKNAFHIYVLLPICLFVILSLCYTFQMSHIMYWYMYIKIKKNNKKWAHNILLETKD